jgi:hypothetical protein
MKKSGNWFCASDGRGLLEEVEICLMCHGGPSRGLSLLDFGLLRRRDTEQIVALIDD